MDKSEEGGAGVVEENRAGVDEDHGTGSMADPVFATPPSDVWDIRVVSAAYQPLEYEALVECGAPTPCPSAREPGREGRRVLAPRPCETMPHPGGSQQITTV